LLASVSHGEISDSEIKEFGLKALDAKFLFDNDLHKYLIQIRDRVHAWKNANSSLEQLPTSSARHEWLRIKNEAMQWIIEQGDDRTGFDVKFIPFLVYKKINRPFILRWPT
jgi:hypothetical protein